MHLCLLGTNKESFWVAEGAGSVCSVFWGSHEVVRDDYAAVKERSRSGRVSAAVDVTPRSDCRNQMERFGWKKLGVAVGILTLCLVLWSIRRPRTGQIPEKWHAARFFDGSPLSSSVLDLHNPESSIAGTQISESGTDSNEEQSAPGTQEDDTEMQTSEVSHAPVAVHAPVATQASENESPLFAPFYLPPTYRTGVAQTEICDRCGADEACTKRCSDYNDLLSALYDLFAEEDEEGARLFVIPVDPLSWMREAAGFEDVHRNATVAFAENLKKTQRYMTFNGSNHVFVCLSSPCQEFGRDLAHAVAGTDGSRAIFAGLNLDIESLKWPCPLRVISLDQAADETVESITKQILQRATELIETEKRWVCSNEVNPPNHFGGVTGVENDGGLT